MTTYIKYQCSACRRTKDLERDILRATPNKCTITKGCSGILISVDQTGIPAPVSPMAGVEDWYPRGESRTVKPLQSTDEMVSLATSSSGALVLALQAATSNGLPDTVDIKLAQRRAENIAIIDYAFKAASGQTVFTGKDVNGKILRIDAASIAEDRVQVRVNGVLTPATLTANTVSFSSPIAAGSLVAIRVQLEKETIERTITLTRNFIQEPSSSRGSWANIGSMYRFIDGSYKKCWLYSADSLNGLSVGKVKIVSVSSPFPAILLLARTPFASVDRYLEFIVPVSNLSGYDLMVETAPSTNLVVARSKITELYPPIFLEPSDYVVADAFETGALTAVIDADTPVLKGTKNIGPL